MPITTQKPEIAIEIQSFSPEILSFLNESKVDELIAGLRERIRLDARKIGVKNHLPENLKNKIGDNPYISDVYDDDGNQYVDIVQEGGGVLGIAHVGFIYVLEQMGIRFFSMAGASAGAITTMLLASIGDCRKDKKSEKMLEYLVKLELFKFVDGKKFKTILEYALKTNHFRLLYNTLKYFISGFIFISVLDVAFNLNYIFNHSLKIFTCILTFSVLLGMIILGLLYLKLRNYFKLITQVGEIGLNPGDVFHEWIKDKLKQNGIVNLENLKSKFEKVQQLNLELVPDQSRDGILAGRIVEAKPPDTPVLCIIATDITTNNKIEFPRMWDLFAEDKSKSYPADYVRASMSIPLFFKCFEMNVQSGTRRILGAWEKHLQNRDFRAIPLKVTFLDGGLLSNFPINVFYHPDYTVPRMPTIGIRLVDKSVHNSTEKIKFAQFILNTFYLVKNSFDNNFLINNPSFETGVALVDVAHFNWLDFFMTEKKKIDLFKAGSEAAISFLEHFDWIQYKAKRKSDAEEQFTKFPNNWN